MKLSWKRAFMVGGFLAGLCGVLALGIAGVDLLTRDTIAKNKLEKEQAGLKTIFGAEAKIGEAVELNEAKYPSLKKYWTVDIPNEGEGRIYSASSRNGYGDVSLLIGVYADFSLGNISVLENTESYAQTLNDNYLEPYMSAEDKEKAAEEVKCGATFGAKMCRDMMKEASAHFREERSNG